MFSRYEWSFAVPDGKVQENRKPHIVFRGPENQPRTAETKTIPKDTAKASTGKTILSERYDMPLTRHNKASIDISLSQEIPRPLPLKTLSTSVPDLVERLQKDIEGCLNEATATSTDKTYESAIRSVLSWFPIDSWHALLPCHTPGHGMVLFAPFRGRKWGTIRVAKSALRAWHFCKGFAKEWSYATEHQDFHKFWKGLKTSADHTSSAKRALAIKEYKTLIDACQANHQTMAGARDKAWIAITFFGVRRISETAKLTIQDVGFTEDGMTIFVNKSKTDSEGKGHSAFIPYIPPLGAYCPVVLFSNWWNCLNKEGNRLECEPVFIVTKGPKAGQTCPDAALRQRIDSVFVSCPNELSTHSLRKGGGQLVALTGS